MRHHTVPLPPCPKAHHLQVFRSRDFRVVEGVNEGDPLSDARDLLHEDVYALNEEAWPVRLAVLAGAGSGPLRVGRDSTAGAPGARLFLDCLLTFMDPTGGPLDALVLVEVDAEGLVAEVYLHPLAPLARTRGYALVNVDRGGAAARFESMAHPFRARGARTVLVDGPLRPAGTPPPGAPGRGRSSAPQGLRPL